MKLTQANRYFNDVHLEGWTGTAWTPLFLYADLLAYDRFIGPRTFGHKQRILLLGGNDVIPDDVEYVRLPNGKRYLRLSHNQDLIRNEIVSTSYIVHEVPYDFDLLRYSTIPAPSGVGGTRVTQVAATGFCDLERYSSSASEEFTSVRYGAYSVIVPRSLNATLDDNVKIDDIVYEIQEINPLLNEKELRVIKRGDER